MQMGYAKFEDIDCVFNEEQGNIMLIAKNEKDGKLLVKADKKKNYFFEYAKSDCKNCYAYIEDTVSDIFNKTINLKTKFIIKNFCNEPISCMEIIGEDVDEFFSPSRYFYTLSKKGLLKDQNLIYKQNKVDEWKIKFEDKDIIISLSFGNILKKGIASDLKLHARLSLIFDETRDYEFVYKVYSLIQRFLNVVLYKCERSENNVDLSVQKPNGVLSYTGKLIDCSLTSPNYKGLHEINYNNYSNFVERLLQFCADNPNLSIKHFSTRGVKYCGRDYTSEDVLNIFSAFEDECKAEKEIYEKVDDKLIADKKTELVSIIEKLKFSNDEEKDFINQAKDKILKLGTEFGQKNKIVNAYKVLSGALMQSIKNIFYLHKLKNFEVLDNDDINDFAKFLAKMRGKKTHSGSILEFTDKEAQIIRFFEVLVYSQILKRAKLSDSEIELVVGSVFGVNQLMFEKSLEECTQS